MKINSLPKLAAAILGIIAGLYLPEVLNFIRSLFG